MPNQQSQMGRARVGDVVVGIRPGLQNGIIYFNAEETRNQKRLVVTREPKHVPEHVAAAVEGLLNQEGRNDWLRTVDKGSPQHKRMAYRGLIASSTQHFLDDAALVDRLRDENDIFCFDTTAASMNSQSFVVVAGIAGYAGSKQNYSPSAEVCKVVSSYLSCLTRRTDTNALVHEPPLANYYEYEPFDLERPGFRLLSLGRGFKNEPINCRLFQAYLPEEESNNADEVNKHDDLNFIPYEAMSYCWGDSTRLCRTVLVDKKVLFVTEYLLDALKSLRRDYEDRILWVDALCIDQSNVRERGHQVGWMGKVYEYADNVLCWLGHVEHTTNQLLSLLQKFKRHVPQMAWDNWTPDDLRWSDIWKQVQSDQLSHDYPSQLKCLMANEWFSRVWILQEVANARKASLGCSEGWVDTKAFAMAPTLLGVKPDNHCQAIIDIMPGPSRKSSWWAQKSNICTLLWRFRESQASDPRDRLYALLGLASDMKVKGEGITADYTKTEEAVVKDITAFLFGDKIPSSTLSLASIADLQTKIPTLSAIALEKTVLSGAGIDAVRNFMQKQNPMVWLSESAISYAWCTQPNLIYYFKTDSSFQEIIRGDVSKDWASEHTTAFGTFLEESKGRVEVTGDTVQALHRNGIDLVQLVLQPSRADIKVNEALVKHIAQQGADSFSLLLDRRGSEVKITRDVIQTLRDHGIDLVHMVLSHSRDDIKITADFIREADLQGLDIPQLLLCRRSDKLEVAEGAVKAAAGDEWSGNEKIMLLLGRRGEEVKITEEVIEAAAGNRRFGEEVMRLLLLDQRSKEVRVTEAIIKTAAGNELSGEEMMRVLLDRRGEEVKITEEVIKAAAGNESSDNRVMMLLLDRRGEEVKITEEVVKAAAGNKWSGYRVMMFLLDQRGEEFKATEEVVKAAAGNRRSGVEVMRLLLSGRAKLEVTNGLLKLLLPDFGETR